MNNKLNSLVFVVAVLAFMGIVAATPYGPDSINVTSNTTSSGLTTGTLVNISGGYIAGLNITATSQNTKWKAFAGWIHGSFVLGDSSGNKIYDWSISTLSGEVFATRNSSTINWALIDCANSTQIDAEDSALDQDGSDNISSTFTSTNTNTYIISGSTINIGNCSSINTYKNNLSQSSDFEEIILTDLTSIVFGTEIENDVTGYDAGTYDFQMIVPGNGNESSSEIIAYYLYVEIN